MASEVGRGEIWLYTFKPPDKRRPVLVLTRPDVSPNTVGLIVSGVAFLVALAVFPRRVE